MEREISRLEIWTTDVSFLLCIWRSILLYKQELPKVTPHICRHTFYSNMEKLGMNPKTLQKIMGHSDIGVTLNTYTHLDFDDIQKEMKEVCNR